MAQLDRITQQPGIMGGKACIRGMRVTVGMIVGQIAAAHSIEEILADYPYLEREDTRITVELVVGLLAQSWTEQEILAAYPHLTHDDVLACLA